MYPIYLDYSATTPLDKRVFKRMIPFLKENFGNSSSRSHIYGWNAEIAIKKARKEVANLINSSYKDIIWTSGATESNNLAIKGVCNFYSRKGNHIISVETEHKSVLDVLKFIENQGFKVTYIKPNFNGLINVEDIYKSVKKNTILISVMMVNNEIGVIQPIRKIGKFCRKNNIIFHCDASQAVGKISIDVKKLNVNLMSFSAHKVYGPKGIGALYICKNPHIFITPQIHGGGHENGLRSGTLATHQIVGMGYAFKIARIDFKKDYYKISNLYKILLNGIREIDEIYINGDLNRRVPHNLNVSFNYIEGESLIMSMKNIALSSGSACTSSSLEPSYVLKSIGINDELAHSSIRFSIGRFTSIDDINYIIKLLKYSVSKLRALSPLWEMHKNGININKIKWK